MDLTPIVDRLSGQLSQVPYVRYAKGAAQALEDAFKQQKGSVWAFVVPGPVSFSPVRDWGEQIGDQERARQLASVRFSVLLVAKNVSDRRGKAAADELHPVLTALRARLAGWVPPKCHTPIECVSGLPRGDTADGYLFVWEETFSTAYDEIN